MRKLIVTAFMSLDGVVQAPGGPGEDDDGGFPYGGWTVPHFDDHLGQVMGSFMGRPFDLVLGRRTYDLFAAYWPHASADEGATPLNDATKHVASRGRPPWAGTARCSSRATSPRASRPSSSRTVPSCRSTAAGTSSRRCIGTAWSTSGSC